MADKSSMELRIKGLEKLKSIKSNLIIIRMKSIKHLLKRKSANISTRATVNINLSVNLLIQRRSANHILREGNVKKILVKTDIPRSVNGG